MTRIVLFLLALICVQTQLLGRVVLLQKGWNPSRVARQYSNGDEDFRKFTFRNPRTHRVIEVVSPRTGKLTKAQFHLPVNTFVEIPDHLVVTAGVSAEGRSISQVCFSLKAPSGCQRELSRRNRVRDIFAPQFGELQVPKNFVSAFPVPQKEGVKIASPKIVSRSWFEQKRNWIWLTVLVGVVVVLIITAFILKRYPLEWKRLFGFNWQRLGPSWRWPRWPARRNETTGLTLINISRRPKSEANRVSSQKKFFANIFAGKRFKDLGKYWPKIKLKKSLEEEGFLRKFEQSFTRPFPETVGDRRFYTQIRSTKNGFKVYVVGAGQNRYPNMRGHKMDVQQAVDRMGEEGLFAKCLYSEWWSWRHRKFGVVFETILTEEKRKYA